MIKINSAEDYMAYDLTLKNENGIPYLKRFVDNFTKKNFEKAYGIESGDISSHRYRSWEYCRQAFLSAKGNQLDDKTIDNLALHLAFYLASWGMYRGSSFLLSLDFTVHKEIVKIVMDEKYDELFDSDTLITNEKGRKIYLNLLFGNNQIKGVVNELNYWYKTWHHSVVSSPIDDIENEITQKAFSNDVSSVLITKVLMGVYGCIPAYDRYVMDGLKTQNVNATFGRKAVIELLDATVKDENVYKNIEFARNEIMAPTNKIYTEFPLENYTFMKVVDMLFWEIGAGHIVYVKVKDKDSKFGENDAKIINDIEDKILENDNSTSYKYEIGGIEFKSKDIGSLIMCVYEEFKKEIKENKQIRKTKVKQYIENSLEIKWLATTRYSRKLMKK